MKTVCAWCQRHMRGDREDDVVSHGICAECFEVVVGEGLPPVGAAWVDVEGDE